MKRALIGLMILLLVAALVAGAGAAWLWQQYEKTPLEFKETPVRIEVGKGANPRSIAGELNRKGVMVAPFLVSLASRWRGDADRLKMGIYQLESPLTLRALLDKLAKGEVLQKEVRFIEGWTFRQMRAAVAQNPDLLQDSRNLTDAQILAKIGASETLPEGLFFPSTYSFSPGASDLEVYRQAYRQLKKALEDAWAARAADLPLTTPYQALILASVVEKETGREADRDKVAGVFINRLRKGMMLQSDPTTIYGLGSTFDGNLRRKDLTRDTPYNTYTRGGLPPTPIALPGKASLLAVTRPASTPALYFVARGDGSSEFSNDLASHNRAVAKFQLGKK
jgi:UPF0755 protein